MKISLLLKREAFKEIFVSTLGIFLGDYYQDRFDIKWNKNKKRQDCKEAKQIWYCNPLINSIFVDGFNPKIFNTIISEYSSNPLKPWKNLIQKIYLFFAINSYSAKILAKNTITISPSIKDAHNKLIIGGNTKLRIIDIANKKVHVILKNGFNTKYIKNDISIRKNFTFLPTPEIYNYNEANYWYTEEYICGISPDRIKKSLSNNILSDAVSSLSELINKSRKKEPLNDYLERIKLNINSSINNSSGINTKIKKQIDRLMGNILEEIEKNPISDIYTSLSHGDFQKSNILFDGQKSWIIDWEFSKRRQIGYDIYVMILNTRILDNFQKRLKVYINKPFPVYTNTFFNEFPYLSWKENPVNKVYMYLFFLEEIDFHLQLKMSKHSDEDINRILSLISSLDNVLSDFTLDS